MKIENKTVETQGNVSGITEDSIVQAIRSGKSPILEELYNVIGYPALANLIFYYGGSPLYIPKRDVLKPTEHQRIYEFYLKCKSCSQTAKVFGVTTRTIYNIIAEQRKIQSGQGDFDGMETDSQTD